MKWGRKSEAVAHASGSHGSEVMATCVESKQMLTQEGRMVLKKSTSKIPPSWPWTADQNHIRICLPSVPLRQTGKNCLAFHQIRYIFRRPTLHLSLFWQLCRKLDSGSVKATEQDVQRDAVATVVYPGLSTNTWQRGRGQVVEEISRLLAGFPQLRGLECASRSFGNHGEFKVLINTLDHHCRSANNVIICLIPVQYTAWLK